MSIFNREYSDTPNVSATILQATNSQQLDLLYLSNRQLFARHSHLISEMDEQNRRLRGVGGRLASMDEGQE
jgi:hypothetical protein